MMEGWHHVYIIANSKNGEPRAPVKVGISNNAQARLKSLQTANPSPLILVCVFILPARDVALAIEAAFHRVLDDKRLSGEWFDLDPVKAVKLMCVNLRQYLECFLRDDPELFDAAVEESGLLAIENQISQVVRFRGGNDNLKAVAI